MLNPRLFKKGVSRTCAVMISSLEILNPRLYHLFSALSVAGRRIRPINAAIGNNWVFPVQAAIGNTQVHRVRRGPKGGGIPIGNTQLQAAQVG